MGRKLLDFNPLTGERVVFEYDQQTDIMRLTHEQDVQAILDGNQRLANNDDFSKRGMRNDMWHYATIPNAVALKFKYEHGVDIFDISQRKEMFRLLNMPEYRKLKTTSFTHGG